MANHFSNLTKAEWDQLCTAIPLIGILIAGADGHIDDDEIELSKKIAHIRSYKLQAGLKSYYQEVNTNFDGKFNEILQVLPTDLAERSQLISQKLENLNLVLAKLETPLGAKLYQSFVSFAHHVAKASGGLMGFFSVNKAEAKWLELPMINPIHFDISEEE